MYFELLGASPGLSNIEHSKTKLEIAVAGTALPVILSLEPHAFTIYNNIYWTKK